MTLTGCCDGSEVAQSKLQGRNSLVAPSSLSSRIFMERCHVIEVPVLYLVPSRPVTVTAVCGVGCLLCCFSGVGKTFFKGFGDSTYYRILERLIEVVPVETQTDGLLRSSLHPDC
jgi:hypothetical protein